MEDADPDQERGRDQRAILDSDQTVPMLVVLDRTAVIELGDERVLVSHHRLSTLARSAGGRGNERQTRVRPAPLSPG